MGRLPIQQNSYQIASAGNRDARIAHACDLVTQRAFADAELLGDLLGLALVLGVFGPELLGQLGQPLLLREVLLDRKSVV